MLWKDFKLSIKFKTNQRKTSKATRLAKYVEYHPIENISEEGYINMFSTQQQFVQLPPKRLDRHFMFTAIK